MNDSSPKPLSPLCADGGFDPGLLSHLRGDLGIETEERVEGALKVAQRLAIEWGVALDGWLPGATCSLVLTGRRDGQEVVLRTPVTPWEIEASLPALLAFAGRGGIEILASDAGTGTTLMPRLRPGYTLSEAPEEEAIEAAADLMLRMRGADGAGPSVGDYLQPTLEASPLPSSLRPSLASDAARLTRQLLNSSPPPRMLHGDLHHFNVLRHGNEWIAIDPEGMVGDPAYECAAFLRNPVPELADDPELIERLRRRIHRFAEALGEPTERIWGWGLVRTVQTVSWSDSSPFHAPWTKVVAAMDELWPEFAPKL